MVSKRGTIFSRICIFDHQICFNFWDATYASKVPRRQGVWLFCGLMCYHLPTAVKTEVPGVTGATAEGLTNSNCCQYLNYCHCSDFLKNIAIHVDLHLCLVFTTVEIHCIMMCSSLHNTAEEWLKFALHLRPFGLCCVYMLIAHTYSGAVEV